MNFISIILFAAMFLTSGFRRGLYSPDHLRLITEWNESSKKVQQHTTKYNKIDS